MGPQTGVMLPTTTNSPPFPLPKWLGQYPAFLKAKLSFHQQFAPLLTKQLSLHNNVCSWLEQITPLPVGTAFEKKSAWLWTRTALSSYILKTLADGTEMAHSIEGRLPFLDHHLFQLATSAKVSSNLKNGKSKVLLRETLKNHLPEDIRLRPKHPFLAPPVLNENSGSSVFEYISDTIRSTNSTSLPYFDSKKVIAWADSLKSSTLEERKTADPALMTILSAILLQKRFGL